MASREAGTPVFYISAKHEIKSFILEYIYDVQNCRSFVSIQDNLL